MYWKSYEYSTLYLVENILAFLCYWSAWFEASIEYIKRNYVIHGMCRRCNFLLGSVLNNIVLVFNFHVAMSDSRWANCNFPSIFLNFKQEKWIIVLFYWWSEFREIFAS